MVQLLPVHVRRSGFPMILNRVKGHAARLRDRALNGSDRWRQRCQFRRLIFHDSHLLPYWAFTALPAAELVLPKHHDSVSFSGARRMGVIRGGDDPFPNTFLCSVAKPRFQREESPQSFY
jgi:hypothetical protein